MLRRPRVGMAEPFAEPFDQRSRAGLVPVRQRLPGVRPQRLLLAGPPRLYRQGGRARVAPAEIDDARSLDMLDGPRFHHATMVATSRAHPQDRLTPEPPWP